MVDGSKRELTKVSQQYQFAGEIEKQQRTMARDVLFFGTPELPQGSHMLETAVHDTMADRATVLRLAVDVPVSEGPLVAGDLFVVSRVEAFDGEQPGAAAHPLAWNGMLLYPAFGEPISKAARSDAAFALPLVTATAPEATVELRQAEKTLATLPVPVEPPAAGGRLMVYGRLPLSPIPPGVYELQVTVVAQGSTAVRQAALTIVP